MAPAPRRREILTDAGPPPTVTLDAGAPAASARYRTAKAKAKAFASTFTWSETPTLEQAPNEPGLYGGVGAEAFAIERVELWLKKGEFALRATSGGVDACLGPEIVVRGVFEAKRYSLPLEAGRGYFQVPRGGVESDAVPFVETTSYQAASASEIEITKVVQNQKGEPIKASGRFVTVTQPRAPFKPMWAAGTFVDAPVTFFAP